MLIDSTDSTDSVDYLLYIEESNAQVVRDYQLERLLNSLGLSLSGISRVSYTGRHTHNPNT